VVLEKVSETTFFDSHPAGLGREVRALLEITTDIGSDARIPGVCGACAAAVKEMLQT